MLVGQLLHNRRLWVPSHVFCFSLGSASLPSPLSPSNPVAGEGAAGRGEDWAGEGRVRLRASLSQIKVCETRLVDTKIKKKVRHRVERQTQKQAIEKKEGSYFAVSWTLGFDASL